MDHGLSPQERRRVFQYLWGLWTWNSLPLHNPEEPIWFCNPCIMNFSDDEWNPAWMCCIHQSSLRARGGENMPASWISVNHSPPLAVNAVRSIISPLVQIQWSLSENVPCNGLWMSNHIYKCWCIHTIHNFWPKVMCLVVSWIKYLWSDWIEFTLGVGGGM